MKKMKVCKEHRKTKARKTHKKGRHERSKDLKARRCLMYVRIRGT